jgi:CBS domain containing-hemolysin-like protein
MSGAILAVELTSVDIAMAVAIVVLISISIMTAVAETALVRITKAKASALADDGRPGGAALAYLVEQPERWLNALLLVVLICQIVQASLTGVLFGNLFGAWGVAIATIANVSVMYVLAETAPKTWAIQHTERAALGAARPVKWLADFAPLRGLAKAFIVITNVILPGKGLKEGPYVSEEELLAVAAEAHESAAIDQDERNLIESIIEFGDTVVREVMVPRPDMVTVNHDFRVADVMEVVILNGYSRIPVLGEGIDDVIGLVFAKDLMRAERDGREDEPVANLVRPAKAVPETKPVAELLREMQADQFHMAVVIDEHGGTAGVVTLEDLIEELVGEIVDEFDAEDDRVEHIPTGGMRFKASLSIDDANDQLPVDLPEGDYDTVSGLVLAELGRMAVAGDAVEVPGVRITVERVQGRRIMRVRIEQIEVADPDAVESTDKASRATKGEKGDRSEKADADRGAS